MKYYITTLLIALAAGALAVAGAYMQRGYWAVGAEFVVPVIVTIALLYMKGEENEKQRN
jgi:hypothetical protein